MIGKEKKMNQQQNSEPQEHHHQQNEKYPVMRLVLPIVRELLAVFFWAYAIIKLFIFDIDIFLVGNLSPNLMWLVNYKFLILLGILAVIMIVTKNRHILLWSLFVIFYPVIFLFWRTPVFLFRKRSWNLVFALVDSMVSFFRTFKQTFILTAFFLISAVAILVATNSLLLWISLAVLFGIHSWIYVQKMILVFKPSGVYQVYRSFFSFLGDLVRFKPATPGTTLVLSDKELELPLESMDEKQLQKWTTGVQWLALFNRVCLFVSKRIKAYQESRFNIISFVFGILILVLFTVMSFALMNFGLYKINPNYFGYSTEPTFFSIFYYSFNNFLFNPIQEITAKAPIAQIASMAESFFALFLIAIFVSLVLTFRSQRETDELNKVITYLTEEGTKAERYLKDKYRLSNIGEAMQALEQLDAFVADWLYEITDTMSD
jgi:hypothetical protein